MIQEFNEFESQQRLFEKTYKGVPVWNLIREDLFSKIDAKYKGYSRRVVADKDLGFFKLIISFISIVGNTIKFWLSKKNKTDILFIAHPRRKKSNGKYIDIYTDPIGSLFDFSHQSLEPMYQLKHFKPPVTKNLLYLDAIEFWSRFFSFFTKKSLPDQERLFWLNIEEEIKKRFCVNEVGIVKLIELEVARYHLTKPRIKRLIKAIEPSLVIEVVSYQRIKKTINIVAKELNISTAELQHGYIGSKHIAYNFPKGVQVDSFPDYLFLWGDYWRKSIQLPIDSSKVIATGFEYFNKTKKQLKSRTNEKQILFISQGTVGPALAEYALKIVRLEKYKDFEVIFKLHPAEFSDSRKRYDHLYKNDSIKVLDANSDKHLYQLILDSSLIVGVYSTALIEALGLGKKVLVLKIPGWEAIGEFIKEDELDIELLEDMASIKGLSSFKSVERNTSSSYLFSKTNYSIVDEIVKNNRRSVV